MTSIMTSCGPSYEQETKMFIAAVIIAGPIEVSFLLLVSGG